ncbi:hypothetical protein, partial [Listeria monocytogenes]|uniref:hypothetical protein n=1 Tax=Listeria monocytogenes TaxID=1639 RepID=UPI001A7E0FA1
METIWRVRANIFYGSSVPRTSAFGSDTTVLQLFMQIIPKCYKTLPNIVRGLLETIACVRANTIYGSSVPRN